MCKFNKDRWIVDEISIKKGEDKATLLSTAEIYTDNDGRHVCSLFASHESLPNNHLWISVDELEANANLIAAAPDMYEALRLAVAMIDHVECPQCDGSGGFYDGAGDAHQCRWCFESNEIKQALAKAEGRCEDV